MVDVKGKWAFITGASRGIGYLSALFLADQGCNLILHSRTIKHLEKVMDEVRKKGVQAHAVFAELSEPEQVERMLSRIDDLGVQVDIVLNNAGVQVAYRTDYLLTPASDYEISLRINTIAPMLICYHFLPKMAERGFGRIVNTSSGIQNEPEQAGYSASKYALNRVTVDLGSRINGTNVIISLADPGWCRTDLGGPSAPNSPESTIPGILVGALVDDKISGRYFPAQDFCGMTMEEAVNKAQDLSKYPIPY
ncbi:MAG: SDR family oxidoreductase [Clostridiales bacterium]|nr:SDR family oxidoreductase [Clostridiales bacterium]